MSARRTQERENPFHSVPRQEPQARPVESDPSEDLMDGSPVEMRGPHEPPGVPFEAAGVLRQEGTMPSATVAVVPLHGGAGSRTVSRVLNLRKGTGGVTWTEAPGVGVVPQAGPAVLVARTSGIGLERAWAAAREWGTGGLDGLNLLGLVLVADAPKPARPLAGSIRRVGRMYPRAWRIGWVPEWHLTTEPSLERIPRHVSRVGARISAWGVSNVPEQSQTQSREKKEK